MQGSSGSENEMRQVGCNDCKGLKEATPLLLLHCKEVISAQIEALRIEPPQGTYESPHLFRDTSPNIATTEFRGDIRLFSAWFCSSLSTAMGWK